jgi:hypothetical protein
MDSIYTKCIVCKKKVLTESSVCKCKDNYCGKHLFSHDCSYVYKQNKILINKVISEKVVRI